MFTSRYGVPVNPDAMTALMAKIIRAHNATLPAEAPALPLARLHDLRHVHTTHLLLAGVPVHVVAERLGHADPSVTLRVYAHVLRQHAAGVEEVFATAIEPGHNATLAAEGGRVSDPPQASGAGLAGDPVSEVVSKPRS